MANLGYVSSGRMDADLWLDTAIAERRLAHFAFRWGWLTLGREHMRQAIRSWKQYRYFRARIK
jgi:hypothetical protein